MTLSHQVPLAPVPYYQSLEPPEGNKRVRLSYPLWDKMLFRRPFTWWTVENTVGVVKWGSVLIVGVGR